MAIETDKAKAIEAAKAKLHEARSFLGDMREAEKKAFGEPRFEHYLSAFLNAGRTVDNRLRNGCAATYPAWRKTWDAQHPSEDRVLKSMHDRRANEFHESGSGHTAKSEQIEVGVGSSYSDKSGTLEVMGSPSQQMGPGLRAAISKSRYFFDVDGTERPVTDVCAEYLRVLEQMVAQFESDDTSP
jgi:hypothetical protein